MHFKNRQEAGEMLATALLPFKGKDVIVYALPRGGVPVGFEVAKKLEVPLDVVIVRKIGHPSNAEYAVGAVGEGGQVVCNEEECANLDPHWLKAAIEAGKEAAQQRRKMYRGEKQQMSPEGKIAVLVDDGIATGLTMLAAIDEIRHEHPKEIIVAIPVTPKESAEKIEKTGVTLVALDAPELYEGAVGAYYDDFPQTTDAEVMKLLHINEKP